MFSTVGPDGQGDEMPIAQTLARRHGCGLADPCSAAGSEQAWGGQGLSCCPCGLWGEAAEPSSGKAFPHPCLLGKVEGRWVLEVLGERYCCLGQN